MKKELLLRLIKRLAADIATIQQAQIVYGLNDSERMALTLLQSGMGHLIESADGGDTSPSLRVLRLTPTFCPKCGAVEDWDHTLEVMPPVLALKCPNGHSRGLSLTTTEAYALEAWERLQYSGLDVNE